MTRRFTLVSFHAHPDDESLLTGGTLARAAAEGHRVVLVVATLGEAGGAGARRRAELHRAAEALGCARVVVLGYRDSGLHGDAPVAAGDATLAASNAPIAAGDAPTAAGNAAMAAGDAPTAASNAPTAASNAPTAASNAPTAASNSPTAASYAPTAAGYPPRFVDVPVDRAAAALAEILRAERADVLTGYDAHGGYGHPDHRHLHHVARAAAAAAATPVLLEATVDRRRLAAALRVLRLAGRLLPRLPLAGAADAYADGSETTHVVDVGRYWRQKRIALRAHASQAEGGAGLRTVALLGRLPGPLFRLAAGREWFIEAGRTPGARREGDVFASLR
ncbi:PIG-L family deacetylase [Actinoplanes subtropicus]|uniref:PIG-L family deacetylase n=1 Tax=Actinoplanes subtropicus TaxID=543632 RepID=UPI0004C37C5C|nr:PIG-L family deacetylase [Actinoplanes subtropicus]